MGVLLPLADAPSGNKRFTDGAFIDATRFPEKFPYLNTPIISSPSNLRLHHAPIRRQGSRALSQHSGHYDRRHGANRRRTGSENRILSAEGHGKSVSTA